MNARSLRALVVLNVVLLASLVVAVIPPSKAQAQLSRDEFIMVAGPVAGRRQQDVVYVINTGTAEIAAFIFNTANNTLEPIDRRALIE